MALVENIEVSAYTVKYGNSNVGTALDTVGKAYPYKVVGDSTKANVVSSSLDAIRDSSTGLHWVNEQVSSSISIPAGTVPPANPMSRYSTWRCIGLLNGFPEGDARNFGAACDSVTNDYVPVQMALYHSKSIVTWEGDLLTGTNLIKPVSVSIVGKGGYVGAQLGGTLPATVLTVNGIANKDVYAIDNGQPAATEDSGRVQFVYIRAEGTSRDNVSGIRITKSGAVMDCGLLNLWTAIKFDGGSAYCQVHRNNINSCNCCIDASGSESHITNNHGYNDSLRTSAQFRPAILIRSSGNIVTENKFFGDGSNTPKGVEIWGFGNVVSNNVLDAFTDVGVLVTCNDASVTPDNNLIIGNQITGIGLSSDSANTFRAGVVITNTGQGAGTIRGTLVQGNSMYNRRSDRQMQYGVVINAVSGSLPDARTIYNTTVSGNTFGNGIETRAVITLGANHSASRSTSNAGVLTDNIGSGSYANGTVIQHGLARPPEYIDIVATDAGAAVNLSATSINATQFTLNIRDSAGAAVTTARQIAWRATRLTP